MSLVDAIFTRGPLGAQLAAPSCDRDNFRLPKACRKELGKFPGMIGNMLSMNFDAVDMAPMCEACDMDDVILYLQKLRKTYNEDDTDLTCDGAVVEAIGGGAAFDTLKV